MPEFAFQRENTWEELQPWTFVFLFFARPRAHSLYLDQPARAPDGGRLPGLRAEWLRPANDVILFIQSSNDANEARHGPLNSSSIRVHGVKALLRYLVYMEKTCNPLGIGMR